MKRLILDEIDLSEFKDIIRDVVREEIQRAKEVQYLSRQEAMDMLDISHPTFRKYLDSGQLVGRSFGQRMRFRQDEVEHIKDNGIRPMKLK